MADTRNKYAVGLGAAFADPVLSSRLLLHSANEFAAEARKRADISDDDRKEIARNLARLSKHIPGLLNRIGSADDRYLIYGLMGDLASLAVASRMSPAEIIKTLNKKRAAHAGKKSGEARREKAAVEWQTQALSAAKDARAKNPAISQNKLAEKITLISGMPSFDTIKGFLSTSENSGALKRPIRQKPRPKRKLGE